MVLYSAPSSTLITLGSVTKRESLPPLSPPEKSNPLPFQSVQCSVFRENSFNELKKSLPVARKGFVSLDLYVIETDNML